MTAIANTREKPFLSLKTQVLATCAAIAGAVALPQLFHMVGALSGLGTAPGEIFLPMHLPEQRLLNFLTFRSLKADLVFILLN